MEDCLTKLYQRQISFGVWGEMGINGEEYFAVYLKVYYAYNEGVLALDDKYHVDM
jgi:hypothetical protein